MGGARRTKEEAIPVVEHELDGIATVVFGYEVDTAVCIQVDKIQIFDPPPARGDEVEPGAGLVPESGIAIVDQDLDRPAGVERSRTGGHQNQVESTVAVQVERLRVQHDGAGAERLERQGSGDGRVKRSGAVVQQDRRASCMVK